MSDLANFITVAAAMAFTCAAFFLLGQTVGLGNIGLLSQFTFADVVDAAPSSVLSMGVVLIVSVWTGEKRRYALEQVDGPIVPISLDRWKDIAKAAAVSIAIVSGSFYISATFGIAMAFTFAAVFAFYARLSPYLYNRLKRTTASWVERWFWAAVMMFVWGCNTSSPALIAPGQYVIRTSSGNVSAPKILQLERGIVVIAGTGFDLIPWNRVQLLSYRLKSEKVR